MRRPNHASRFEGIAKTNLQASRASDTETLQSQVNKAGKKRLSLSGLEVLHGRLSRYMRRWLVERFFAWIQWQRRILVRWEYYAQNFLGFVQLACLVILFRRF